MFVKLLYFFLPALLFVRTLFGKILSISARIHEARPDTLVEVSGAVRALWSAWRAPGFPGFDTKGVLLYVRIGNIVRFLP